MYEDLPGLPFFLVAIALAPAFVSWRRGRILARALDDPALPERLDASRRRNGSCVAVAFGVLAVMSPSSLLWTIPLLIAAQVIAAYPLRKVLYAETWTLGGYLAFVGRLGVGIWGFWIALALLPLQVPNAGRFDWIAAIAGAGALMIWNARADVFLRRLLGSRPLADPVLLSRFIAIAERSSAPVPRFEWVPLNGGAIANAVAIPALTRSSVVFTETLLTRMDADEACAICAHEIAHLEHHTPRMLHRMNLVNIALISFAAFVGVLPRLAGWRTATLPSVLWLVVLFGVIIWRARDRQKNETASDVRAIALTGDAEALVRALTRLYLFARMPRRIDTDMERRATHPSLARRIRDIRAAAGATPATLGSASVFNATDGRATVTFDSDRLHWAEGDVATHSLSYSQFSELRLQAATDGAKSLVAVERGGRRFQAPLAHEDVPRLQAVLDIVDGRLADAARPPATFGNLARFAAGMAAVFGLAVGQIAMAIAGLIALLQPSTAALAGAGIAALASSLAAQRAFAGAPTDVRVALSAMLALLGVGLLGVAHARRGDRLPPRAMLGVAALAICALCSTGLLLLSGANPIPLHLSARTNPTSGILLLALGTTLALLPRRAPRYASAPLLAGGLAIVAAGSPWFLDRFGRDPFLQPAPPIAWSTVEGALIGEVTVPLYASSVELSPSGRALLAQAYDPVEDIMTVHVARTGGRITRTRALHLVFMDDDRVLGLYEPSATGEMEIRETPVDAPERVTWRRPMPDFAPHALSYEPATRTWTVRGFAPDGSLVQVEGHDASPTSRETRWASLGLGRVPEHAAVTGETALVHDTQYLPSLLQRCGWWQLALLMPTAQAQSRFTRLTATAKTEAAVSRLPTECVSARTSRAALVCSAFDGTRTRFASLDPETGQVTPMAWLPGHFRGATVSASGWLSGWADWDAVAVRPSTREGLRFTTAAGRTTQLAVTDRAFAVVSMHGDESLVRVYARDAGAQRANAEFGMRNAE